MRKQILMISIILFIFIGLCGCSQQSEDLNGDNNQDQMVDDAYGLPPIFSEDHRESVEELFESYNGEVPKTVFRNHLEQLSEQQLQSGIQGGPSSHNIYVAYSNDESGASLEGTTDENGYLLEERMLIIEHGSVPDAIIDTDGIIRLYFVDTSPLRKIWVATDALTEDIITASDLITLYEGGFVASNNIFSVAKSSDGEDFTIEPLAIKNLPEDVYLADPSVVRLENDSYRLYFLCVLATDCTSGDPASSTHHRIASAISSDGKSFVYEGINYDEGYQQTGGGLSDPEVYKTGDYYRLFIHAGGGRTNNKVLTSYDDGKTFDDSSAVDLFGTHSTAGTGLRIVEIPNGYRMYFCENSTTYSATSDTNGETWTMQDEPKVGGRGSMAPVRIPDDSSMSWEYLLYFHA
jgi:hypothetical protein